MNPRQQNDRCEQHSNGPTVLCSRVRRHSSRLALFFFLPYFFPPFFLPRPPSLTPPPPLECSHSAGSTLDSSLLIPLALPSSTHPTMLRSDRRRTSTHTSGQASTAAPSGSPSASNAMRRRRKEKDTESLVHEFILLGCHRIHFTESCLVDLAMSNLPSPTLASILYSSNWSASLA